MPINYIRRGHQYGQAQTAIDNALYQMERAFAALPPGVSRNLATEANMLLLALQEKCAIENALAQLERVIENLPAGEELHLATEANMLLLTLQKKCRRHVYPKSSELCTWATLDA